MEAYTGFAEVYDTFMDETPYEEWAAFLTGLLVRYGVSDAGKGKAALFPDGGETPACRSARALSLAAERNLVVDLGCGTGTLTELLADAGFDMIGIDSSEEMLAVAAWKKERSGREILYLLQDMRELALYGAVGAVVSVCDSLNYILEEEELLKVFALVNNYLYPGGVFIFDFNTVYKYETVIGDATIAENREDCSFIWENYYDPESGINEYDLTLFVRTEADGGLFRRFTETHLQRGYTLKQMTALVEQAGMKVLAVYDADTHGEAREESERIYVVAGESGKEPENE